MLSGLARLYRAVILRHPVLVLTLVALISALAAFGLPNFKLDASADSLTLESDRSLDFFREINQRYRTGDFLVVTYTPHAEMFSDQSLEVLKSLHDDLEQVQGVESVNSILNVPLLYSPMRSLAEQQEETRTLLSEDVDREQAKQEFLNSPIYRDMILSEDGRTTALQLNLAVDDKYYELVTERDSLRVKAREEGLTDKEQSRLDEVSQVFRDYRTEVTARDHARVEEVRGILAQYEDHAELFLGGVSMITSDMIAFIQSDLMVFGTAILVFIIAMLAFIFRQWRFVLLPLATCVLAVVIVLGWLSWIDWRLTVISSNFVALLLIMTLALTIHLVVRYRETHAQHPDWSQEELVADTTRFMVRPCLYTALTTIVAFVSLVVSDIRPVIDFGWMMTIGLSVAFVLAFVIIPAGLMLLPKGEPKDKGDQSGAVTLKFSKVAENHGGTVVAVALIAALISAYGMTKLEVDNRFIDYFQEDTEIYQGMSVIDRQLGGTINLDIILDAPEHVRESEFHGEDDPFADPEEDPFADDAAWHDEDDPFADPEDGAGETAETSYWFTRAGLQDIQALHQYLESLPEVGKVQSLSIAYDVARDISGSALNDFELAVMRRSMPPEISEVLIDPYLSDQHQQARITLRVKETSPELERMQLVEKIHTHAHEELGFDPDQVRFTGMLVLYNNMLRSLFNSQIVTLGAVFVGIMLMFLVLFRSFRIAIIAILPNMLAASVVLGGMGLAGIPLDMMTITIAAITVGVGVDHAIHYLYRFRKEFSERRNYVDAMHASHASIGRAMYYTAIIIIVGFSILALSRFIPSIYFGLLTALAMFTAIVGSLTLLPKLVLMTKPFGSESKD
ncbi:RND family transporter [Marinimicrobium sp. ABcell2]|uniref:efflux RND transporter permease subunit n=1 Tax=Marinimicrobium sp. ABcell2 TaxID=3069751 RepID=UPI0027B53EA6|nr:MMPL family transporter [Marinimicrobium sp. ABcell2]MDQ2077692.1 MMPL family transporter [Marinimicrobium sp. ABcell2]